VTLHPPRGSWYAEARGDSFGPAAGYTVSIRPDPPTGPAERRYPARGYRLDERAALFMAALDRRRAYEITITHDGGGELGFMDLTLRT
jgi:hypothetical protein